jgi:large subunit ribosomal protein L6
MPIAAKLEETIEIPDEVNISREGRDITVTGPNGENKKSFPDKRVNIEIDSDEIRLSVKDPSKREKALLGTYASHMRNMINGSVEDFEYKLKILYSHFPVKVRSEGDNVVVENFVGEQKPRKAKILGDTKVEIQGDIVTVKGPDKEKVAQTAANIESMTKIKNVDERVFQDGIYLIEKVGKPIR